MPKVLLIDDDAALTGMLTEFLRGEGFETAAAFWVIAGFMLGLAIGLITFFRLKRWL